MNSFNFIARGIEAEVERQIGVWESGGEVEQQTYDFDAATGTLTARRSKEEADDYRYFPEPDLVPVEPPRELVERAPRRAPRAARRADPPDRARRSTSTVRPCSSRAASTGSGTRRSPRAPTPVATANVIANTLVGAGVDAAAVSADGAREARRRSRPHPAHRLRRGDREARRARASPPTRTSRRRPSPTPLSSSRSSRGSSRRTRPRSRPTAAARRACSASSSVR